MRYAISDIFRRISLQPEVLHMGANKTYRQKGNRGRMLVESDEFRRLRYAIKKGAGDRGARHPSGLLHRRIIIRHAPHPTVPTSAHWRSVLTDFPAYPTWNPFITSIDGKPQPGAQLRVTIAPPGRQPITFRPVVLTATPWPELRWRGRLLMPGLFDGEHAFQLELLSNCRLPPAPHRALLRPAGRRCGR
jgi:hypothetical protein